MIQIDMPMPESCVDCRFSQGGYMYCHAMPENFCGYVNYCEEDGRPEWCPLEGQKMIDREKVMKGLELCGYMEGMPQCDSCPYDGKQCWKRLKNDALALLKDAVPVVRCKDCVCGSGPDENGWYMCSNTGGGYPADGYCSDGERRKDDGNG